MLSRHIKEGYSYMSLLRNSISYVGLYLAVMGLVLFLFTIVIDWMRGEHSAYIGLLWVLFLGMVLLGGLLTLFGLVKLKFSTK